MSQVQHPKRPLALQSRRSVVRLCKTDAVCFRMLHCFEIYGSLFTENIVFNVNISSATISCCDYENSSEIIFNIKQLMLKFVFHNNMTKRKIILNVG